MTVNILKHYRQYRWSLNNNTNGLAQVYLEYGLARARELNAEVRENLEIEKL